MSWMRFWLGIALTAGAGAINAVSFSRLGAVYASFMSGNTVQVGLHGAHADGAAIGYFLVLVGMFMAGGFAGAIAVARAGPWHLPLILLAEAAAVAGALWLDLRHGNALASTAPLALAMGAQNHLVVLMRGANPATTFVTGTAFRFSDALAQRVLGRDPHGAWKLHLLVWLSFAVGAALGTLSHLHLADLALAPVAALFAALALTTGIGLGLARRWEG